jgi:hypothetical protein
LTREQATSLRWNAHQKGVDDPAHTGGFGYAARLGMRAGESGGTAAIGSRRYGCCYVRLWPRLASWAPSGSASRFTLRSSLASRRGYTSPGYPFAPAGDLRRRRAITVGLPARRSAATATLLGSLPTMVVSNGPATMLDARPGPVKLHYKPRLR